VDPHRQAWIYAAATVALWSTVATAFELALRTLTPGQLLAGANLVAVVALVVICLVRGEFRDALRVGRSGHLRAVGLGLLNPLAYYLVLLAAYDRLPGQVAQPLNYTWAITLALLAVPVLGQKLVRGELPAMLLAWAGVLVIATDGDPLGFSTDDGLGVALALGSTLIWSVYWLAATRDPRRPVGALMLNFSYALPLTCLVGFLDGAPTGGLVALGAVVWIGLAEMAVSFVFWLLAMQRAQSTAAISSLIFASPFVSLILLATIAGEPIRTATPVGLVLVVAGMLAQQRLRAAAS
jgi:drug/metabolite transporter (DMT)-like permease